MNELRSSVWHGRVTLDGVNVSDRCLGVLVEGDRAVAVRLLRRAERGYLLAELRVRGVV